MPTDVLSGARYPSSGDSPNIAVYIQNAVNDLSDNVVNRFATATARDSAFTSWVNAGNTMADGMLCFTQSDKRFWRYDVTSASWLYAGGQPPPIAALSLATGWTATSGYAPGLYKDASGLVRLIGGFTNTNTYTPGGNLVATLPSGYIPVHDQAFLLLVDVIGASYIVTTIRGGTGRIETSYNGSVSIPAATTHTLGSLPGFHINYTGTLPYA